MHLGDAPEGAGPGIRPDGYESGLYPAGHDDYGAVGRITSGFPVHPDKQEFNDLKKVSYATSRNRWSPVDLLHQQKGSSSFR